MNSVPYCEIGPSWIILFDEEECPLSKIKFDSEGEVRCVVNWLNKFKMKKRFELNVKAHSGIANCFQIWDNVKNKPLPFAPLHMKSTDPTSFYQEYVDFLNELYEENPLNE